jgi:DNA-binding transcriptional ArsR family regulator
MEHMTSRQLQAIRTKKKLLDVSMEMIQKHGYDSVTINQICEAAGVSIGAFYHHLKSKAGIIIEGYSICDEYFENEVYGKLSGDTYFEKIIEYIGFQSQYAIMLGVDLIIQIYRAQITEGTEFFFSDERGLPKGLASLVQRAQENGELTKDVSYQQISMEVLVVSRGIIYNWCQNKGKYDLIPKAEAMIRNYLYVYQMNK